MKKLLLLLIATLISIFIFSCDTTEPDPVKQEEEITLTLEQVNPEEAALRFTSTTIYRGLTASIYRVNNDTTLVASFPNTVNDTLITDDNSGRGLDWNTNYTWYAALADTSGKVKYVTQTVTAQTGEPDSTTRDFTFETFIFDSGSPVSTYFNDVWVFDENNIWAVGYIASTDTSPSANILQWNGTGWKIKGEIFNTFGIYGVWAASSSDIFFTHGAILRYKNNKFSSTGLGHLNLGGDIKHVWGSSSENVYAVGENGAIVHFDGAEWRKIDFEETNWDFLDITGNSSSGVAYALLRGFPGTNLIKITPEMAEVVLDHQDHSYKFIFASTSYNDILYLTSPPGSIYQYHTINNEFSLKWTIPGPDYLSSALAVNDKDIYFFGENYGNGSVLVHYNGKSIKMMNTGVTDIFSVNGIHGTRNISVGVGKNFLSGDGFIQIIRRQK